MASFISRLLGRFKKTQSQTRRSRQERTRKLRLEPMEARRLMASDLGSIGGNVFTDLTDNGFDVGDTDLQSVTVWLYSDGAGTPGLGTFESGGGTAGGDDVLVGTAITDANGEYLFDGLGPGRYFVEQAPVAGQLQRASETVKTVDISDDQSEGVARLTIDNFFDETATVTANAGTPVATSQTPTTGSNALGNERDIVVNWDAGGLNNISAQVTGGLLSVSPDAGTSGSVVLTYDGADGDAATIDHSNLNVDLTQNGAVAFQFLAGAEPGNTLTVDIYSGPADFSTITVPLPVTAGALPTEDMFLKYADFNLGGGSGVDWTSVTAIRFTIQTDLSSDASINLTQTVAPFLSTQNFANLNPLTVGNQVWRDSNNNGLLDGTETGINDVTVEIYADTNANGIYDSGVDTLADTVVTSTVSGVAGTYLIGDLLPGDYFVVIPAANFGVGQALEGYTPSTVTPVPNVNTNIDDDNNGEFIGPDVVAVGVLTIASAAEPDGADNNSNLRIDFGFVPEVNLAIEKTVNSPTVNAGESVTYTLTVTNDGPGDADNVVVQDTLPAFLQFDEADVTAPGGTVTVAGQQVQVVYTSLADGASQVITIVAAIPPGQAETVNVLNTATVTSDSVETDDDDNESTVDIDVTRSAVLTIDKTGTPTNVGIGGSLTYTITVTNTGPSTATNVVIEDVLPTGLEFDEFGAGTSAGVTPVNNSGTISATVPTLAVGDSVVIEIVTTVLDSFVGTSITNEATADSDEPNPEVSDDEQTGITPEVDLAITKADDVDPVNRGGVLVYTLNVTNNGPGTATNVEVVDTLPAGVTFASATVDGVATVPTVSGNELTFSLGDIASGAPASVIVVTVNVEQTAATQFTNSALVRSTETTGGFDTDMTNNTATETTNTQTTIDLGITKTDSSGGGSIVPGETLTYTLIVTNTGPSDASGVRVTDNIPDGIQITSATADTAGVTITVPPSAQDTTAANNDDLIFDIGNLAVGATVELTVVANVLSATTGNLVNTAVVATTISGQIETNTTNNTASVTTTLTPEVDVAVTKTGPAGGTVIAGNAIMYTINVTNNGPSTATGVTLNDTLPAGLTFTSATSNQGTVSQAGGVITGTLGVIDPGETVVITVNATVNGDTRGSLSNTATVLSTETDTNTANNTSTVTTTVDTQIDLSIVKSKTNPTDPAVPGGPLTYTLLVTNTGPSTATSVVVTDVLPTGLTFTTGSSTVGTVTSAGQTITANVGTLAPGASATVTINANVADSATGTFSNTATVAGAETESNTANNTSTLATDVAIPGSIAGRTYLDSNNNGVFDAGDTGIAGVTINLTGTDILGDPVAATTTTDANGEYIFDNLLPGTYTVSQVQPAGYQGTESDVGTGAGGTAGENQISNIVLTSGVDATGYNFAERLNPLSKRRFLASSGPLD